MKLTIFKHWNFLSIIVLIASAGWIWQTRVVSGDSPSDLPALPKQGFPAPDFSLSTMRGEVVSLESYLGRPVLINLWTSWCPPCKAEMPAIQKTFETYKDQGFTVLAVNATNQDDLQAVAAFTQEYGLSFPILLDIDGSVSKRYQLHALPTSFFIDRDGIIQEVVVGGPMAEALLEVRVKRLLENNQ